VSDAITSHAVVAHIPCTGSLLIKSPAWTHGTSWSRYANAMSFSMWIMENTPPRSAPSGGVVTFAPRDAVREGQYAAHTVYTSI
jgi:hypothetical protein